MKFCAKCNEEIYTKDGENLCEACERASQEGKKRRVKAQRSARHDALTSIGLVRVRGAMGGVYYE